MMFLLGRDAMLGHDPPIYLRSITATRFPSPAKVHAATVEPVPPPRITRSYSSVAGFSTDWSDEALSMFFMRFFLSELPVRPFPVLLLQHRLLRREWSRGEIVAEACAPRRSRAIFRQVQLGTFGWMQNTIKCSGLKCLGRRSGSGGGHCFLNRAIGGTHAHGAGTSRYVVTDDPVR